MDEEIFKPIPGYVGRYDASSLGRIKSIERFDISAHRKVKEKVLKPTINPVTNYHTVNLRQDNELVKSPKYVHNLVALTFIGPCPEGKEVCHYPDKDKGNNKPSNLIYGTRAENLKHRELHGTMTIGERNGGSILVEQEVHEIRKRLSIGKYGILSQLSREYGVSHRTIWDIKMGKRWGWLPIL